MIDAQRYFEDIVRLTLDEFGRNPGSRRHAFLACVTLLHTLDYLAVGGDGRPNKGKVGNLRKAYGGECEPFKLIDKLAHAFKHVRSDGVEGEFIQESDVRRIVRGGLGGHPLGAVPLGGLQIFIAVCTPAGEVNLTYAVRQAAEFLGRKIGIGYSEPATKD